MKIKKLAIMAITILMFIVSGCVSINRPITELIQTTNEITTENKPTTSFEITTESKPTTSLFDDVTLIVTSGSESIQIEGYPESSCINGICADFERYTLSQVANNIRHINYSGSITAIINDEPITGAKYSIFNSDYELISSCDESLSVPETIGSYYIKVDLFLSMGVRPNGFEDYWNYYYYFGLIID